MRPRTDLHTLLLSIVGTGKKVYFQPPSTLIMTYPCIVYGLNDINSKFADNKPYNSEREYVVTVIDPNPDSPIPDKIAALPKTRYDRHLTIDNLNHDIFTIYF